MIQTKQSSTPPHSTAWPVMLSVPWCSSETSKSSKSTYTTPESWTEHSSWSSSSTVHHHIGVEKRLEGTYSHPVGEVCDSGKYQHVGHTSRISSIEIATASTTPATVTVRVVSSIIPLVFVMAFMVIAFLCLTTVPITIKFFVRVAFIIVSRRRTPATTIHVAVIS
jgi:hypothetical protein